MQGEPIVHPLACAADQARALQSPQMGAASLSGRRSSADSEVLALQENQDCYLLQLDRADGWCVMGVFDGHGVYGGKVSAHVRTAFGEVLGSVDGRRAGQDPRKVRGSIGGWVSRRSLQ